MMSPRSPIGIVLTACVGFLTAEARIPAAAVSGRVVDAATARPLAGAIITAGDRVVRSNADGLFVVDAAGGRVIGVRAAGYLRLEVPAHARGQDHEVRLTPFRPKALYLSVYGIGDKHLRTAALALLDTTELNALVIDLKGDRGIVPFRSSVALADQVGAQRVITIGNLAGLVTDLRRRGIYSIARIVVFKDNLLALGRPGLAVHRRDGSIFRDGEGLGWTKPHSRDVWRYNVDIAVEAARAGFDEIQFDYARLPDAAGLAEMPSTEQDRVAAIDGFLTEARERLTPFNVFLAIDVFGYVCWNLNDTGIGQKLERLAGLVDYVSPMLYPSSFQFGIPGYRNPVQHPQAIVKLSLDEARRRTGLPAVRFRPWLQAFRDYAFGGRVFTADEIRAQIEAAEDFGADGWMLWNPNNRYSAAGLRPAVHSTGPATAHNRSLSARNHTSRVTRRGELGACRRRNR